MLTLDCQPPNKSQSLKTIKEKDVGWAMECHKNKEKVTREVEEEINLLYNSNRFETFNENEVGHLYVLESHRKNILLEKEEDWHLKSQAI